ncbi:MAG: hypothetical protein ACE5G1_16740, partial [bacterium]
ETVYQVTSVTTRKPALFDTPEGVFRYRHVKSTLYFGFEPSKDDNGLTVQMATPEKALLDFFYLNQAKFSTTDKSIFETSYRLQTTEALRVDRLRKFATRFGSRKLERLVELFIEVFPGKLLHA